MRSVRAHRWHLSAAINRSFPWPRVRNGRAFASTEAGVINNRYREPSFLSRVNSTYRIERHTGALVNLLPRSVARSDLFEEGTTSASGRAGALSLFSSVAPGRFIGLPFARPSSPSRGPSVFFDDAPSIHVSSIDVISSNGRIFPSVHLSARAAIFRKFRWLRYRSLLTKG